MSCRVARRSRPVWLVSGLLVSIGCQRTGAEQQPSYAEQVFASVCAKCHGSNGGGGLPAAEGANAPRNFRDASFQASRSDEQLKRAIRSGKGAMPAFGNVFSDADLEGLVRKIRSFDPAAKPR